MKALARLAAVALLALAGCSSGASTTSTGTASSGESGTGGTGGTGGAGGAAPKAASSIEHLVVIIQENHSFDTYFGTWCTAAPGSDPTCPGGPSCCEAGPGTTPGAAAPVTLDDTANEAYSPDHNRSCELAEMDGGAMDAFVTASCGSASNFAYADAATTSYYRSLAGTYALADRYFQPVAGASSANDMFFARAGWVFDDNTYEPKALGAACAGPVTLHQYTNPTIGDLLAGAGVPWAFYAEGYAAMKAAMANGMCPAPPADCPIHLATYPCDYDPGDDPFAYYKGLVDDPAHFRDLADFDTAVTAGTLPAVSYVKAIGYKTEHPGDSTITIGEQFVKGIVDAIQGSTYAHDTLVLVTWDESGGYFDHVKPPPAPASDMQPYGPRVPLLAVGDAVKPGLVSHTVMEHSSIARFIEWNWLGQMTGQLGTRDALVNNLGSLLDPAKTMVAVPEQ